MAIYQKIIALIFVMSLLVGLAKLNSTIVSIHISEMDQRLLDVSNNELASLSFSIFSRYNLIKERIETGEGSTENYIHESKIQTVLSEENEVEEIPQADTLPNWHPVKIFLSLIQKLSNWETKVDTISTEENELLDEAYLLERKRRYPEAISLYRQALTDENLQPKSHALILIHSGFCLSMIGDYDNAIISYQEAANKYPSTPEGALSRKLINFITLMQYKKKRNIYTGKSLLESGKNRYKFMDYPGAIKELSKYLETPGLKDEDIAHFYKGRSHEELGEYDKAITEYKDIMNLGKDNKWATNSNRRIVILGNIYEYDDSIVTKSSEILVKQGDSSFITEISSVRSMGDFEKQEVTLEQIKENVIAQIKKEESDLTKKQLNEDRIRANQESIARRKIALTNHKDRAIPVLQKTIQSHLPEITDVYTKFTNKGSDIEGDILIEIDIHADGIVQSHIVSSTITDTIFLQEFLAEINELIFPSINKSLGTMKIRYPFSFSKTTAD